MEAELAAGGNTVWLPLDQICWVIWMTVLGGAVGSFLNVVVYRLPRGKSIAFPPSHCPLCQHPIRWFDNIPVIGWLVLRGRCRDCHAPISPRYPLVEATVATMFGTTTAIVVVVSHQTPPSVETILWMAVVLLLLTTLLGLGLWMLWGK